ncbi:MAG TPA: RtcB family protein [Thermotogota bacterium]|nr:RtcB family protein [Thermotogota bacterium]
MKEKNRAPIFPPFEVKGRFATALVYAQTVDEKAVAQIIALCNQPFAKGTPIRVMPDVHTGAGCVIGLTMDLSRSDAVCPNLVGVDIGCGVRVSELGRVTLDWQRLDDVIREFVPSGQNVHRQTYREDADFFHSLFNALFIKDRIKRSEKMEWLERSLGTLGGGNHFIEVDTDNEGRAYLIVHSGSRHFGLTVAKLYQESAIDHVKKYEKTYREKNQAMARALAAQGRSREIEKALKSLKKEPESLSLNRDLAYLEGPDKDRYLHDIRLIQTYAEKNRQRISETILQKMGLNELARFESVHNYIDDRKVLRKGAIAAYAGQSVIIPLNMRDGCALGIGKGNPEWNWSAPHGAGRLMSRHEAKKTLSLDDFRTQMKGVFSTCVDRTTLDESPMAYKAIKDVLPVLKDTVDILRIIRPVYNFKASE